MNNEINDLQMATDHYINAVNLNRADYNMVIDTRNAAGVKPLTYVEWLESQLAFNSQQQRTIVKCTNNAEKLSIRLRIL